MLQVANKYEVDQSASEATGVKDRTKILQFLTSFVQYDNGVDKWVNFSSSDILCWIAHVQAGKGYSNV